MKKNIKSTYTLIEKCLRPENPSIFVSYLLFLVFFIEIKSVLHMYKRSLTIFQSPIFLLLQDKPMNFNIIKYKKLIGLVSDSTL